MRDAIGTATCAGHTPVESNLRFVIRISKEYTRYGLPLADLVQEGNLGLVRAVRKFDPDRGVRLLSYAVWWIRSYIQKYIIHNWSLVKIGTTQGQRKAARQVEVAAQSRLRAELRDLGRAVGIEAASL